MAPRLMEGRYVSFAPPALYKARPETPGQPRRRSASVTPATHGEALTPETRQVIVLVAEDEETIAETLALIVADVGYVAIVARDGREALALARQHRPQLIITDLMMPYMSGADLITSVRADAAAQGHAPPPVVVVTAASRARAEEAGADAVVVKPFDVSRVEAVIHQLLPDDER